MYDRLSNREGSARAAATCGNRRCFQVAWLLAAWLLAVPANAHQKWLWPNRFEAEKGPVQLSFDVSWSDRPFTAEDGVGDKPLNVVEPRGRSTSPERTFVGKTKSTAECELSQPGTYRLESIDPLAYWSKVETDGQTKWLKLGKDELGDKKSLRSDLYWSKAIAYVTLGEPTPSPGLDTDPLSIATSLHPNAIEAGQPLTVTVRTFGSPLPAAKVSVFHQSSEGHEPLYSAACNQAGQGELKLDMPGMYLLACEHEQKVTDDPKADLHSFNVYLTLLARPNTAAK